MCNEAKRLRDRAASQLRQSRRSRSATDKVVHLARAASLKAMAANEEWSAGVPQRSRRHAGRSAR